MASFGDRARGAYLWFAHNTIIQSIFLLAVRLYWGWLFAQTGWGKLHNLDHVTNFFSSLGIPAPGLNAHFVAGLEFVGGILLILGLGSRFIALLLTGDMCVAFLTADLDSLRAIFSSDPSKFYESDPFTFLFAALIILIFGPGIFSVDHLLQRMWSKKSGDSTSGAQAKLVVGR